MKILFVVFMLVASRAYAEEPASNDYHDTAVTLAKCSGYYKAMMSVLEKANKPAAAEQLKGQVNGWTVASWMMFSAAHDPKGTKTYGAWKEMAESYAETGRSYMAFLLEQDDVKGAEELTANCLLFKDLQAELIEHFRKRAYTDEAMKE